MARTDQHGQAAATDLPPATPTTLGASTDEPQVVQVVPAAEPSGESASSGRGQGDKVPGRSAASTTYVGVGGGLVVLVVILIFIIQNLHSVSVHFFTARFSLPTGVIILAAAVAGGLLVLLTSGARVLQLRRQARRANRA